MTTKTLYKVEETNDKVLNTAQKLFTENGFFDTQMIDIAKEVGVSRTSLYRYYKDKLTLGLAILEKLLSTNISTADANELLLKINQASNGLEKLQAFLLFCWADDRFDVTERFFAEFDTYFSTQLLSQTDIQYLQDRMKANQTVVTMQMYIEEGIKDNSIVDSIDINLLSITLINSIRSLKHKLILRGNNLVELKVEERNQIMQTNIHLLLNGLKNK